jgi:negative regulator of sigma E activity
VNPIDGKGIDDKALDEYLKGGSPVSQRYRELGADAVPGEVDRLVLQHARAAVAKPKPAHNWRRWSVPVALAASVVLVVTILLDPGVKQQAVLSRDVMPKVQQPAADQAAERADRAEARKSELEQSQSERVREEAARQSNLVVIGEVAPRPEAPAFVPPAEVSVTAKRVRPSVQESPMSVAVSPTEVPTPNVDTLEGVTGSTVPEGTFAPAETATPAAQAAVPVRQQESRTQSYDADEQLQDIIGTGARRPTATAGAGAGPRNTVPRNRALSADEYEAPAAESGSAQPRVYTDPERWLEDIRELRRNGKDREADQEWERFRAAFPNHPVADSDMAVAKPKR